MLDLLKIVEILQNLEKGEKGCISKSNFIYVELEKLTSEISNIDGSVEDIAVIYGSFDKAMEYYFVIRVRNNLDNRF